MNHVLVVGIVISEFLFSPQVQGAASETLLAVPQFEAATSVGPAIPSGETVSNGAPLSSDVTTEPPNVSGRSVSSVSTFSGRLISDVAATPDGAATWRWMQEWIPAPDETSPPPAKLSPVTPQTNPGFVTAGSSSASWQIPPVATGSAWWHSEYMAFDLHSQPFLRVRSPSASTIEGINRALIEFACPSQSVDRAELWLRGRDSTEPLIDLIAYPADGRIHAGDASRNGTLIGTFRQSRRGVTVVDVTEWVRSQSALADTHLGFRMQLANEAKAPIGLNVRAEWDNEPTLVLYPTCYADCDSSSGPNTLNMFDFLCFQQAFVAGSAYACNCDTSTGVGVCDLFDFLCFQQTYLTGCP